MDNPRITIKADEEISIDNPNADTLASFEEGDKMINNPNSPRYSSIEALFEDLMD